MGRDTKDRTKILTPHLKGQPLGHRRVKTHERDDWEIQCTESLAILQEDSLLWGTVNCIKKFWKIFKRIFKIFLMGPQKTSFWPKQVGKVMTFEVKVKNGFFGKIFRFFDFLWRHCWKIANFIFPYDAPYVSDQKSSVHVMTSEVTFKVKNGFSAKKSVFSYCWRYR